MNIKNVTIKNFRNFKDFSIDFTDGYQTIIGENNIGKSNLYWAIRLVLDKDLSYNARNLELKDFHGFKKEINLEDHVIISIELYSKNLSHFSTFHSLKTSETTARVTYVFAHKQKFFPDEEFSEKIDLIDFQWHLFPGGIDLELKELLNLDKIHFKDLDGINLYYISAFRNINSDLHGSTKSLLSKYCQSRKDSKAELEEVKTILKDSSSELNKLPFIPDISSAIQKTVSS